MNRRRRVLGTVGVAGVAGVADQVRRAGERRRRRASAAPVRAAAVSRAVPPAGSPAGLPAASAAPVGAPDQPVLVVVMPALDEEASVSGVLADLPATVCGLAVVPVVVDDGSSDDTATRGREAGALIARHDRTLGQGDALRTGFEVARRLGAAVVVTMDADGQHDPAELGDLVAPVRAGHADYVQGSRFLGRYDDSGGVRDLGIRAFRVLINVLAGTTITDVTNGYRAVDSAALSRLHLVEDRFSAAEILLQAAAQGLAMREVPVHIRGREVGSSRKPRGLGYPLGFLGVILRTWLRSVPAAR